MSSLNLTWGHVQYIVVTCSYVFLNVNLDHNCCSTLPQSMKQSQPGTTL